MFRVQASAFNAADWEPGLLHLGLAGTYTQIHAENPQQKTSLQLVYHRDAREPFKAPVQGSIFKPYKAIEALQRLLKGSFKPLSALALATDPEHPA